ncbi:hypothetical protein [Marinobacter sp. Arc7-DN-1]|uniref:hypothetical protein n=1 Tax=Marinobacter sp. Arc7-DN-1 TaxID=2304594 RepID=UPI001D0D9A30|nr:hypothetical protein [Marinobacter sp. Arc7-DN-1]
MRWAFEIKDRIDNAPLLQQGPHDGIGALGLEDPACCASGQTPERGLDDQFVAGAPVAGIARANSLTTPVKRRSGTPSLPDGEIDRLFQNVPQPESTVGTGQLKATWNTSERRPAG